MSVRLDRWNDVKHQAIPRVLPTGLESIGIGLGIAGKPLQNIGQIASMYYLKSYLIHLFLILFPDACCIFFWSFSGLGQVSMSELLAVVGGELFTGWIPSQAAASNH